MKIIIFILIKKCYISIKLTFSLQKNSIKYNLNVKLNEIPILKKFAFLTLLSKNFQIY